MPRIPRPEWRPPLLIPDPILVGATDGVSTWIEGVGDFFNMFERNVWGKQSVHAMLKASEVKRLWWREREDLPGGVYTSVGAASNTDTHRLIKQPAQDCFNGALDGWRITLQLPSVIISAVVFECDFELQGRYGVTCPPRCLRYM